MTKSILVIDDNNDIRENTAEILELAGYKTFVAENGKRGVELAIQERPSLIVCDIMMPELDGYGVLHLIRKNPQTQTIPLIFLTAKSDRGDFRKGMEMGADDYIPKPYEEIELLNAIQMRLKKDAIMENSYEPTAEGIGNFIADARNAGILDFISEKYAIENYSRKQILYQENKKPRYLFFLKKGKVKSFKSNDEGKDYITNLYHDGDFIGYSAILNGSLYDDTAIILEESDILAIPKEDFLHMINKDIGVAAKFIQIITSNMTDKENRLLNLAYSSLRKRVAASLVDIVTIFKLEDQNKAIEISREEIAQYVGTATESLIRTLSDFKAEKLIEIQNGRITFLNLEKLKNLVY
jgi:CheY-like chemotaxis protein/CRP-like cAMP-binding protein